MKFIDRRTIQLDKILNELDTFVLAFIRILEKHTDYVIISGYVSLLFGRSRSTEDVDVFIKELSKEQCAALYDDLRKKGYWCLNAEELDDVYALLSSGSAARFAVEGTVIPNFEVKVARTPLQRASFIDRAKVITRGGDLWISSLERHIAFKRYYLKSEKDLEDAQHIEDVFAERIDLNTIAEHKKMIEREGR